MVVMYTQAYNALVLHLRYSHILLEFIMSPGMDNIIGLT